MRIRRRLPIVLAVLLIAAAVAVAVVLRKHAPPEPARLLPGADGFVYVNLGWMRRANITGELPPVPHDPDYEKFIEATGFQFERDLDEAALAIHYPANPPGAKPDSAQQPRYSEVFVGKIDGERLRAYLARSQVRSTITKLATSTTSRSKAARCESPSWAWTRSQPRISTTRSSSAESFRVPAGWHLPLAGPHYYANITKMYLSPASAGQSSKFNRREMFPLPARAGGHFCFRNLQPSWPRCAIWARSISRLRRLPVATKMPANWPTDQDLLEPF